MSSPQFEKEELLHPGEAADLFGVNRKTLARWVKSGKLSAIKTLGGHHRFKKSEVMAKLKLASERKWPASGR